MNIDSVFIHKNCGGEISVDITGMLQWKSPSIRLTTKGIEIGVTEIRAKNFSAEGQKFVCLKCKELIENPKKELEMQCQLCQEILSIKEMNTCTQINHVCISCTDIITGKKEPTTSRMTKILQFLFLGDRSSVTFTKVTEVIDNIISFE